MKNLKFLSVMFCCIAAMSFASCSNDDDQQSLTKDEKAQCFQAVKGSYTGKMIYASANAKNSKDITDTVDISWNIATDSTMTIAKFPSKLLAANVTDASLKAALEKAEDQTVTCRIGFIQKSPIAFLINPVSLSYPLNYGSKDHKVQVAFYVNNTNSIGMYNATSKLLQMQVIEGGIYEDGKLTTYLKTGVSFFFTVTKK